MTPLRRRMLEDMQLRNFSAGTQRSYIHYVEDFANFYHQSPMHLGLDDIRNYQLHLIEERRLSPQSINCFTASVQFLYTVTLEMPWTEEQFTRLKVPERLPVVLSAEEVAAFFSYIGILKHQAVLMVCYGSGLRISEAVSLKLQSIDSGRMLIHVEEGKGAKDRYTVLSGRMLLLLREYWKMQRPQLFLFPGTKASTHVQPNTIRAMCRDACRLAGITKRITPHVLYYHVVFTTPQQLNPLALQNKRLFYTVLFEASAQTLLTIAADPRHLGARIGFFSLLHASRPTRPDRMGRLCQTTLWGHPASD